MRLLRLTLLMVVLGGAWWWPVSSAQAHRVRLFCAVEGGRLCCRAWFGPQAPARNSVVVVKDKAGKQVLAGSTDQAGRVCFKAPPDRPLTAEINAGAGHVTRFTIEADD
ncbi:MAG: hypothetical protein KJ621_07270 [Proteobacteria bacterium]|nr:hypothetical protein [Pseudomonadota bacterium]MBU1741775.1 hypothetical protein [Pseudomonadota bacterium]